ncbi:DUF6412 domain-containing protein [Microbacterium sp. zg.B48]|uniref:DUF6412 domain-containing protein n=1 Tax=unclassified Microbacterium TaxID=2609290 RepID=UPI00214D133E|nr:MULTISPECIES: DUF6412 domain-containing protein [unclassified Microbacterium]MCR2762457.1 DUF6412 domain-containing protein [Microbacterium sp. zg.B48]MCR2810601.1 DUF6412 domain-containing protein [Microbacterium sp. zg.B185]WIM18138.1 DUF6412 domain-containing protein [Microbacterium sp. zg-B185]
MADMIGSFLQVLLTSLGLLAAGSDPAAVTVAVAVISAAALILTVVLAITLPRSVSASLARPRRTADVSAPMSQSDPDAAGHPRSRAPGLAASAA